MDAAALAAVAASEYEQYDDGSGDGDNDENAADLADEGLVDVAEEAAIGYRMQPLPVLTANQQQTVIQ